MPARPGGVQNGQLRGRPCSHALPGCGTHIHSRKCHVAKYLARKAACRLAGCEGLSHAKLVRLSRFRPQCGLGIARARPMDDNPLGAQQLTIIPLGQRPISAISLCGTGARSPRCRGPARSNLVRRTQDRQPIFGNGLRLRATLRGHTIRCSRSGLAGSTDRDVVRKTARQRPELPRHWISGRYSGFQILLFRPNVFQSRASKAGLHASGRSKFVRSED